jgi:hypothetical protein
MNSSLAYAAAKRCQGRDYEQAVSNCCACCWTLLLCETGGQDMNSVNSVVKNGKQVKRLLVSGSTVLLVVKCDVVCRWCRGQVPRSNLLKVDY